MNRRSILNLSLTAAAVASGALCQPQPGSAPAPKFEVASVHACKPGAETGGRSGGGNLTRSPGRLDLPCQPVRQLIRIAYVRTNFRLNGGIDNLGLEGGPGWIDSEQYRIDAKPDGPADQITMEGPMLQSLLEERFHLKTHRETREMPVYVMTVAKGGLKMQPSAEGSCLPRDASLPYEPPPEGSKRYCGDVSMYHGPLKVRVDLASGTMQQFAQNISGRVGRPIVDKTGLTQKYDFHVEFAPDGADLSNENAAQPIFTALAALGLKLEPGRGPREFQVIDSIERPSEN